ncbi:MAG TPA: methylated-DNA--[protein]-cysteine S-methyltransferase [Chloroflexota bacterium]|nr:methylated-DNA--[protein]-cysteine S-methyltransferase [Chloroflexota bacterium]
MLDIAMENYVEPQAAGPETVLSHATLATQVGRLHLYGTADGLMTVVLPNESREAAERRLCRLLGPLAVDDDVAAHERALQQLAEYFAGRRQAFDLPLAMLGTPFQQRVWQAVAAVPYGQTRSYGEIARAIGRPAAVRAVGAANGANPLPPIIPCHRLIGADGGLTGYGGGLGMKAWLLELERRVTDGGEPNRG